MGGQAHGCVGIETAGIVRLGCWVSTCGGSRSLVELDQATVDLGHSQGQSLKLFAHQTELAIVCARAWLWNGRTLCGYVLLKPADARFHRIKTLLEHAQSSIETARILR